MNQHVDRQTLLTTSTPVPSARDPLLDAIQAFRDGLEAYNAHPYPKTGRGSEARAIANTYGPALERLSNWNAPATTVDGAIAALRMAKDELGQFSISDVAASMVSAALSFHELHKEDQDGDTCSVEDLVGINFEPWTDGTDLEPPSNDDWLNPTLVTIRLAFAAMFRTKAQLSQIFIDDPDLAMDTADRFASTMKELEAWRELLSTAHTRMLVAGAVVATRDS